MRVKMLLEKKSEVERQLKLRQSELENTEHDIIVDCLYTARLKEFLVVVENHSVWVFS